MSYKKKLDVFLIVEAYIDKNLLVPIGLQKYGKYNIYFNKTDTGYKANIMREDGNEASSFSYTFNESLNKYKFSEIDLIIEAIHNNESKSINSLFNNKIIELDNNERDELLLSCIVSKNIGLTKLFIQKDINFSEFFLSENNLKNILKNYILEDKEDPNSQKLMEEFCFLLKIETPLQTSKEISPNTNETNIKNVKNILDL